MAKIVKSVRLDQSVIDLTNQYIEVCTELFGSSESFSEVLAEALPRYLYKQMSLKTSFIDKHHRLAYINNGKAELKRVPDETYWKASQLLTKLYDKAGMADLFEDADFLSEIRIMPDGFDKHINLDFMPGISKEEEAYLMENERRREERGDL